MMSDYADMTGGQGVLIKNANNEVRLGFVRKVYGILTVQLLLTSVVAGAVMKYVTAMHDPAMLGGLLYGSLFVAVACMCCFTCCPNMMRSFPTNYICLFLFTFCEAVLIGVICTTYKVSIV